jgi:hypothetical protein
VVGAGCELTRRAVSGGSHIGLPHSSQPPGTTHPVFGVETRVDDAVHVEIQVVEPEKHKYSPHRRCQTANARQASLMTTAAVNSCCSFDKPAACSERTLVRSGSAGLCRWPAARRSGHKARPLCSLQSSSDTAARASGRRREHPARQRSVRLPGAAHKWKRRVQ